MIHAYLFVTGGALFMDRDGLFYPW